MTEAAQAHERGVRIRGNQYRLTERKASHYAAKLGTRGVTKVLGPLRQGLQSREKRRVEAQIVRAKTEPCAKEHVDAKSRVAPPRRGRVVCDGISLR